MGVVDEDGGVVLLGRRDDRRQGGDVAVHAEDAVGHDQDRPVGLAVRPPVASRGGQELAQVGHVLVAVDHPRRLREAHPVDDRGVVELVGDDQVGLAGHDRDDPGVAGEARLEGEHGLDVLEGGERRLQLLVEASSCPEIVRTAPEPAPNRRAASAAASTSRGCVFSPR